MVVDQDLIPQSYDTFSFDAVAAQELLEAQPKALTKTDVEEGATARSAFANLWNSILCGGASMLALPAAARLCGVYIFPIVVIFIMFFNAYTSDLLVVGCRQIGARDYASFVSRALGPWWTLIMDLLLFLFCCGGCTSILQGAVDSVLPLVRGPSTLWLIVGAGSAASISLMTRTIDSLAPISAFSFILVNIFVCAMSWQSALVMSDSSWSAPVPLWPSSCRNLINGASVICLSWTCQYSVMPIFSELRRPQRQTWLSAMPPAVFASAVCFILCGVLPMLTYPSSKLTLFAMYAQSRVGKCVSFLFGINFIIMLPLIVWVGSRALLSLVTSCLGHNDTAKSSGVSSAREGGVNVDPQRHSLQGAIVAFYVLMVAFSLTVPDVDLVINITSTLVGVPIMVVIPPIAYAVVCKSPSLSVLLLPCELGSGNWVHSFSVACFASVSGILIWAFCIYSLF